MSTPCLFVKEVDLAIYDKTLKGSLLTSVTVTDRENTKEEKIQRHDNPGVFRILWAVQN